MTGNLNVRRLQRTYWRALNLYMDLAESTYSHLVSTASEDTPRPDFSRIQHLRQQEDRAWVAYIKARNEFVSAVLESGYQESPKSKRVDLVATPL